MFDGTNAPPAPNWQALAEQFAQLRIEDLARIGIEIVNLRINLEDARERAVAAEKQAAELRATIGARDARIAELETRLADTRAVPRMPSSIDGAAVPSGSLGHDLP